MSNEQNFPWALALSEYERRGEPNQAVKSQIWQAAIGLQQVDGLTTSEHLLNAARENIEGRLTIDEVQARIESHYIKAGVESQDTGRTREADLVATRIATLLATPPFSSRHAPTSIFTSCSSKASIRTPDPFAPTTSRKKNGFSMAIRFVFVTATSFRTP